MEILFVFDDLINISVMDVCPANCQFWLDLKKNGWTRIINGLLSEMFNINISFA